jgi:hypothetical protein
MATYFHLPVYKASYDLVLEMFKVIKDFNREYKYTLGENIKKEAVEMITNIYRANSSFSKEEHLEKAREKIETIRIFFRLARDLRQVGLERFVDTNEKIENISKQITSWKRSTKIKEKGAGIAYRLRPRRVRKFISPMAFLLKSARYICKKQFLVFCQKESEKN